MKRESQKKIPPEVFAAAVAARDIDQLIELLRPFVARAPGAKRTVGVRQMSPDDLRRYNAKNQRRLREARAKDRAQNLTPDDRADTLSWGWSRDDIKVGDRILVTKHMYAGYSPERGPCRGVEIAKVLLVHRSATGQVESVVIDLQCEPMHVWAYQSIVFVS